MTFEKGLVDAAQQVLRSLLTRSVAKPGRSWTPSGYILFVNEVRPTLKATGLQPSEVLKKTGEMWRSLDAQSKGKYLQKAADIKQTASPPPESAADKFVTYSPHKLEQVRSLLKLVVLLRIKLCRVRVLSNPAGVKARSKCRGQGNGEGAQTRNCNGQSEGAEDERCWHILSLLARATSKFDKGGGSARCRRRERHRHRVEEVNSCLSKSTKAHTCHR